VPLSAIDVGIMTRANFEIEPIRSAVDTVDAVGQVFNRNCPRYEVRTLGGTVVHVLAKRFKSQSGGDGAERKHQCREVRGIVNGLVVQGEHVVVLGDFNQQRTGRRRKYKKKNLP
jgi:endonuclease/exonuclease/phosphatase family metal-dependent hydrolase